MEASLALGLYVRLFGLVFATAFAGLLPELTAICGDQGVKPLGIRLRRWDEEFCNGSWLRRLLWFPSLAWLLGTSNFALRLPVLAGLVSGLLMFLGVYSNIASVVAWLCYVHCAHAMDLWFPWEALLAETGFLTMFLPSVGPISGSIHAQYSPDSVPAQLLPITTCMLRILVCRLLLGFGKIKFGASTARDSTYLQSFVTNQPIPSPVGWFMRLLPVPALQAALAFMWLVEIPLPILPFLPLLSNWLRFATGVGFILLMVGIQVSGNFGHFNVLSAVLSILLLDTTSSVADIFSQPLSPLAILIIVVFFVPHSLVALVAFFFNSWVNMSWYLWPKLDYQSWIQADGLSLDKRIAAWVLEVVRFVRPWLIASSYGVFPPQAVAPLRWVVVFEGSPTMEGDDWLQYRYGYQPTQETDAPCFVAPYHPRMDHSIYYAGMGHDSHDLNSALFMGEAFQWNRSTMVRRVVQRLLEGNQDVANSMFSGGNPFPDKAPLRVRCRLFVLQATTFKELRTSGRWWRRKLVGMYLTPHSLDMIRERGDFFTMYCDSPLHGAELTHWDKFAYKRRSARFQRMIAPAREAAAQRAAGKQIPSLRSLVENTEALGPDAVNKFWALVDQIPESVKKDWTGLRQFVEDVVRPAQNQDMCRLDLVLWRYSYMMAEHFEPAFWRGWEAIAAHKSTMPKSKVTVPHVGPGLETTIWPTEAHEQYSGPVPKELPRAIFLPDHTHFHLAMVIHHVLLQGESRTEQVWANPALLLEHVRQMTWHEGMAIMVSFYYDMCTLQASGGRVVNTVTFGSFGEDQEALMLLPGNLRLAPLLTACTELQVEGQPSFYPHLEPPHPQAGWGFSVPNAEKLWRANIDKEAEPSIPLGLRSYG